MRFCCCLTLLLLLCSPLSRADESRTDQLLQSAPDASRYLRTVEALAAAPAATRTQFAALALTELVETLLAEADLARREAADSDGQAKLLDWAAAVEAYAEQLLTVLQSLEQGAEPALRIHDGDTVAVDTGAQVVLLAHPRAAQQRAFEQRLLQAFCSRQLCRELTLQYPGAEPIPLTAGGVRPAWSFTRDGPRCAYLGLQLQFGAETDPGQARLLCEQLVTELAQVTRLIEEQQRHGVRVDWPGLSMTPLDDGERHLLNLTSQGDVAVAALPLLYSTPGLLENCLPWVRARLAGQEGFSLLLRAAGYNW